MRRFHFWSQFAHIFPSDSIKNCLRKAKIKTSFWNVSRDCIEIWCFWAQIRNLRTKLRLYGSFYDHWWFLWVTRHRILIWSKSCFCCSRTAQPVPVSTDRGFKFAVVESTPSSLELKYFFDPMCASPFMSLLGKLFRNSDLLFTLKYFKKTFFILPPLIVGSVTQHTHLQIC